MKTFIILFLCSLFCSYKGHARSPLYSQKLAEKRQTGQSAKQVASADLENLAESVQEDMKKLLFTLTHEHTSEKEKGEIISILSNTALLHNDIISALEDLVARGDECENTDEQTACRVVGLVNIKAQAELMRRKVNSLIREEQEYKDMILDGVLVITGVGLLFIPVGGPAFSTGLFTLRFATMGKVTGSSIVTGIGLYRSGREIIGGEDEDLKTVFEFVSGAVATNILTQAIFHFAQIGDEELLKKIVLSSSTAELIELFYSVIENSSYSDETRRVAIETLLAFPEELQIRRTKTVQLLQSMVDIGEDIDLGVRISAVRVLGKIGERVPEVAEYLAGIGGKEEAENELRLLASVQAGRNKENLEESIEKLLELITDRRNEGNKNFPNNLEIQLEIPQAFLDLLRFAKEDKVKEGEKVAEKLQKHIAVVREFILSEIMDIETRLEFSRILISWTEDSPESSESLEIKVFLRETWTNPAEDVLLYVEQLEAKKPTQENKPAFAFLKVRIGQEIEDTVKNPKIPQEIVFARMVSIIDDTEGFYERYPNQEEIAKKLKIFIIDYQKMHEKLKN